MQYTLEAKLLLVDDEANILRSLLRLFRGKGYTITQADSGERALEILETQTFSVIISDYRMPGMNGAELLRKISETSPETIRIMLSGYSDLNAVIQAINEGHVYRFLTKPWNDSHLLQCVKEAFEQYFLKRDNNLLKVELEMMNDLLNSTNNELKQQLIYARNAHTRADNEKLRYLELLDYVPLAVFEIVDNVITYTNKLGWKLMEDGFSAKTDESNAPVDILDMVANSESSTIHKNLIINNRYIADLSIDRKRDEAGKSRFLFLITLKKRV